MARPRKPARTTFHKSAGEWFIHDGEHRERTGVRDESDLDAAGEALRKYLASKSAEPPQNAALDEISCAELLNIYINARGKKVQSPRTLGYSALPLLEFFGDLTPRQITPSVIDEYVEWRAAPRRSNPGVNQRTGKPHKIREYSAGPATCRRDIGVLLAAINYAHDNGILRETRKLPLPPSNPPLDRGLSRTELAWLIRAAAPHLRRFILISYRLGRRQGAVLDLKWKKGPGGGHVDFRQGIVYFEDPARPATKKQRGSAKAPPVLLSFMHRWRRQGREWLIEHRGERIAEIDTAFHAACRRAEKLHADWITRTDSSQEPIDLSDATPHALKHTAITFYFQDGGDLMPATKYFATSAQTLERVYFSHHPEGQAALASRMARPGRGAAPKRS